MVEKETCSWSLNVCKLSEGIYYRRVVLVSLSPCRYNQRDISTLFYVVRLSKGRTRCNNYCHGTANWFSPKI